MHRQLSSGHAISKKRPSGSITTPDGDKYEGQLGISPEGHQRPDGVGRMDHTNGDVYEGSYTNGTREGQGKLTLANGDFYVGTFLSGKRCGRGILTCADGVIFEGLWFSDQVNGAAKWTQVGKSHYEGQFRGGKRTGNGKQTFEEADGPEANVCASSGVTLGAKKPKQKGGGGEEDDNKKKKKKGEEEEDSETAAWVASQVPVSYSGQWVVGIPDGEGVTEYSGGLRTEGKWSNGKLRDAQVTYPCGDKYQGVWDHDILKPSGTEGTMRYNAEHKTLDVYEGPWLNGLFAGNGELVYSSGDMYKGVFKKGFRDGFGTLTLSLASAAEQGSGGNPDAEGLSKFVYEGQWKKDERDGFGVCKYPSGHSYRGDWKKNHRFGDGEVTCAGWYRPLTLDAYFVELAALEAAEAAAESSGSAAPSSRPAAAVSPKPPPQQAQQEEAGPCRVDVTLMNEQGDDVPDHTPGAIADLRYVSSGDTYKGRFKIEKGLVLRNALGLMKAHNGHSYFGHFKSDAQHGKGTLTFDDNDRFDKLEGEWVNGMIREGRIHYVDGAIYVGGIRGCKWRHGTGSFYSKATAAASLSASAAANPESAPSVSASGDWEVMTGVWTCDAMTNGSVELLTAVSDILKVVGDWVVDEDDPALMEAEALATVQGEEAARAADREKEMNAKAAEAGVEQGAVEVAADGEDVEEVNEAKEEGELEVEEVKELEPPAPPPPTAIPEGTVVPQAGMWRKIFPNGDSYSGGRGVVVDKADLFFEGCDPSTVTGKDVAHGEGKMNYADGGGDYSGGWVEGRRHGEGFGVVGGTGRYQGGWSRDAIEGEGSMAFDNGDVYVGQWDGNKYQGKGKLSLIDTGNVYEGAFKYGEFDGIGTMMFTKPDPRTVTTTWSKGKPVDSKPAQISFPSFAEYDGIVVSLEPHGEGSITYTNGTRYTGQFDSGARQGSGSIKWPNGLAYNGPWKKGERTGNAKVGLTDTYDSYQDDPGEYVTCEWDQFRAEDWVTLYDGATVTKPKPKNQVSHAQWVQEINLARLQNVTHPDLKATPRHVSRAVDSAVYVPGSDPDKK